MISLRSIFRSALNCLGPCTDYTVQSQTRSFHSALNHHTATSHSHTFRKWAKRVGLGLSGALVTTAISGVAYQIISTKIDEKKYRPIGTLIDINNYNMHLYSTGTGGPTVILDAGLGCNSLEWSLVQPEISKFTKVTSFDRPGNGWSDASPLPRTCENIVTELHTALHKANIPGPYVFVGHSYGGLDAQLFANLFPQEVLGLILVDSSHAEQLDKMERPTLNHTITMLAARLGIARFFIGLPVYRLAIDMFPEPVQDQLLSHMCTTKFMRTVLQETSHLKTSCSQLKATENLLGNKPLIVISAVKKVPAEGTGYTQEQIDAFHTIFQEFQKDLVTKSTQSKQVFATESDHMITRHQPQIIIDSIKEMVERLRKQS